MSGQMRAVGLLMRATRKRTFSDPDGGGVLLARPKGDPTPPESLTRGLRVETHQVTGFPVVSIAPQGAPDGGPVVVHVHGGAYVNEISKQHWQLARTLAMRLGCEVLVPLYGLAPDHDAAAALTFTTTLVDDLAGQGRAIYLSGDSSGGGLALLTAQHASPSGRAALRGLGLMAPWVDLTLANPEIESVERCDPWLARAALHEIARTWAASWDVSDPRVSPISGDFEGLPPVDLWVGDRDICMPDSRRLCDLMRAAGVAVNYVEQPGAIHVYPLLPVPEGRAAREYVVARAGAALGITPSP
jgi:monoterpene epsilon-lactone hydrolase